MRSAEKALAFFFFAYLVFAGLTVVTCVHEYSKTIRKANLELEAKFPGISKYADCRPWWHYYLWDWWFGKTVGVLGLGLATAWGLLYIEDSRVEA